MAGYIHVQRKREIDMASVADPVVSDVRQEWDWVKYGVEEILKEDRNLTFRPEDVYAAVLAEQAILWTTDQGFVVTTSELDTFNGEKTFLVWLAWARERGHNLAIVHRVFFEEAAKGAGFDKIEVRSAIPEVRDYLINTGWEIDTVVFTRYL